MLTVAQSPARRRIVIVTVLVVGRGRVSCGKPGRRGVNSPSLNAVAALDAPRS